MTSIIDDKAMTLLIGNGWTVSDHLLQHPSLPSPASPLAISFIDKVPNRSVSMTGFSDHEVLIAIEECTGNTVRAKLDVQTAEVKIL